MLKKKKKKTGTTELTDGNMDFWNIELW